MKNTFIWFYEKIRISMNENADILDDFGEWALSHRFYGFFQKIVESATNNGDVERNGVSLEILTTTYQNHQEITELLSVLQNGITEWFPAFAKLELHLKAFLYNEASITPYKWFSIYRHYLAVLCASMLANELNLFEINLSELCPEVVSKANESFDIGIYRVTVRALFAAFRVVYEEYTQCGTGRCEEFESDLEYCLDLLTADGSAVSQHKVFGFLAEHSLSRFQRDVTDFVLAVEKVLIPAPHLSCSYITCQEYAARKTERLSCGEEELGARLAAMSENDAQLVARMLSGKKKRRHHTDDASPPVHDDTLPTAKRQRVADSFTHGDEDKENAPLPARNTPAATAEPPLRSVFQSPDLSGSRRRRSEAAVAQDIVVMAQERTAVKRLRFQAEGDALLTHTVCHPAKEGAVEKVAAAESIYRLSRYSLPPAQGDDDTAASHENAAAAAPPLLEITDHAEPLSDITHFFEDCAALADEPPREQQSESVSSLSDEAEEEEAAVRLRIEVGDIVVERRMAVRSPRIDHRAATAAVNKDTDASAAVASAPAIAATEQFGPLHGQFHEWKRKIDAQAAMLQPARTVKRKPAEEPLSSEYFQRLRAAARKRHPWTNEEEKALLKGVGVYGLGNWTAIKKDPALMRPLRNRTNEQLKDKFRSLEKRRAKQAMKANPPAEADK